MYLGVRAVIAKSIERIHLANLINFGIMPLIFKKAEDYEGIQPGDELHISETHDQLRKSELVVVNQTRQKSFSVSHSLTPRQVEIVLRGGLLNYVGKHDTSLKLKV
jgi:aconitate hydratase